MLKGLMWILLILLIFIGVLVFWISRRQYVDLQRRSEQRQLQLMQEAILLAQQAAKKGKNGSGESVDERDK